MLTHYPAIILFFVLTASPPERDAESAAEPEGVVVSGSVIDSDGAPRSGALVSLIDADFGYAPFQVITEADGRFRLRGLPPGRFRLGVHAPGYHLDSYSQSSHVLVGEADQSGMRLVVQESAALRVRVVGATGPVSGARVFFRKLKAGNAVHGQSTELRGFGATTGEGRLAVFDTIPEFEADGMRYIVEAPGGRRVEGKIDVGRGRTITVRVPPARSRVIRLVGGGDGWVVVGEKPLRIRYLTGRGPLFQAHPPRGRAFDLRGGRSDIVLDGLAGRLWYVCVIDEKRGAWSTTVEESRFLEHELDLEPQWPDVLRLRWKENAPPPVGATLTLEQGGHRVYAPLEPGADLSVPWWGESSPTTLRIHEAGRGWTESFSPPADGVLSVRPDPSRMIGVRISTSGESLSGTLVVDRKSTVGTSPQESRRRREALEELIADLERRGSSSGLRQRAQAICATPWDSRHRYHLTTPDALTERAVHDLLLGAGARHAIVFLGNRAYLPLGMREGEHSHQIGGGNLIVDFFGRSGD